MNREGLELVFRKHNISSYIQNDLIECIDYDIVVIADDSSSMNMPTKNVSRWVELRNIIGIIADIGGALNENGIGLCFINQLDNLHTGIKSDEDLRKLFANGPRGNTPLMNALNVVMTNERFNHRSSSDVSFTSVSPISGKVIRSKTVSGKTVSKKNIGARRTMSDGFSKNKVITLKSQPIQNKIILSPPRHSQQVSEPSVNNSGRLGKPRQSSIMSSPSNVVMSPSTLTISNVRPFLDNNGDILRPKLIIIAVDGFPTTREGYDNKRGFKRLVAKRDCVNSVISILVLSEDDGLLGYLDDIKKSSEMVNVLRCYDDEKEKVMKVQNRDFPYSLGDHVARLLLCSILDKYDKLGEEKMDIELPNVKTENKCCVIL
jgi:hypothetical protein